MAKQKKTLNRYDVIVVGGGLSGLTAANYLAREGKSVLVLEQSHTAGGCMAGFWRKGFYFDGGDQSFESVGAVFPILKDLNLYDRHHWERCGYRLKTPKRDYIVTSYDVIEENLQKEFPGESGIRTLFSEVRNYNEFFSSFMNLAAPDTSFSMDDLTRVFKHIRSLGKWMDPGYKPKLLSGIQNRELRDWFENYGYDQMPFILFAGFWHMWINDYWYPAGGIQHFIDSLVSKLEENGGHLLLKTPAAGIQVQDGRVTGVATEGGRVIRTENVVYTGDYKTLVFQILGEQFFKPAFVAKVRRARVTESFVSVFLGLDIPAGELREIMQAHHVVRFPGYEATIPRADSDVDVHARNWVELSSPSFGDPDLAPQGKSSLVLQTLSTAHWQNYWQNQGMGPRRTAKYRQLKQKVGTELVRNAEAVIPDLSNRIEFMEVASPLTLHRFTRNTDGASAGWSHDQSRGAMVGKWGHLQFRTPVRGLFTAGHYTFWPGGVPSAITSGKYAADFVLKRGFYGQLDKVLTGLGL